MEQKLSQNRRLAQHSIITDIAELARAAYVFEHTQWNLQKADGRPYTVNPKFDKDRRAASGKVIETPWKKIARFVAEHQISQMRAFVHAQFRNRYGRTIAPTPMQCYGPVSLQIWTEFCDSQQVASDAEMLRCALAPQKAAYFNEKFEQRSNDPTLPSKEVKRRALFMEASTSMSALFRYCTAVKVELPEVAEFYYHRALMQYLVARDAYNVAWGTLIPGELREAALRECRIITGD